MYNISHLKDRARSNLSSQVPAAPRGCRPETRQRKSRSEGNIEDRMKWLVIDIPCCSASASRKPTEQADDGDAFKEKDFVVDKWGLRRISPSLLPRRDEKDQQIQSFLLDFDRLPQIEDDCLSVASTSVGDDVMRHGSAMAGTTTVPPMNLRRLDKRELIGRGSCGVVWRAVDPMMQDGRGQARSFAIKELPINASPDEEQRRIILDELRIAYSVDHACVVPCVEVFFSRGVFSLVMEYMDGGSLLDALKAGAAAGRGGLACDALAHVGRSVAEALAYLHEELHVLHRDVKPSNILLSRAGAVKVGDLGICSSPSDIAPAGGGRGASAGGGEPPAATQWIGTVTYMSPERILGDAYSYNADVWSLGVVLAEAALCRYPFAPAGGGGGGGAAGRPLQFWDLLDLVVAGPCPSEALAAHLAAAGEPRAQEAAGFVRECLARDLQGRPGARRCLAHPFLDADAAAAAAGRAALAQWLGKGPEPAAAACAPAEGRAASPPRAGHEVLLGRLEGLFKALSGGGGA